MLRTIAVLSVAVLMIASAASAEMIIRVDFNRTGITPNQAGFSAFDAAVGGGGDRQGQPDLQYVGRHRGGH